MKITGTRSYIDVEDDGRIIRIEGELTTTPAFYADVDSIKHWSFPEDVEITAEEKRILIECVIEETRKPGMVPVYFD